MTKEELKARTKKFALNIIMLSEQLPRNRAADVLIKQLLQSSTSVGANYRAACRSRSTADFISKITIVEEEADESMYWLELISESHFVSKEKIEPLWKEANELTAIFTASGRTAKGKGKQ
ncbi:MAG: four helix bundle protein [Ignavibacteriales bacterium]|nr:four helix bundle protein [Ignavibacteriales bacterium]